VRAHLRKRHRATGRPCVCGRCESVLPPDLRVTTYTPTAELNITLAAPGAHTQPVIRTFHTRTSSRRSSGFPPPVGAFKIVAGRIVIRESGSAHCGARRFADELHIDCHRESVVLDYVKRNAITN
jgi:hypothetical protein